MKYIMLHGLGQSSESWSDTVKVFNDDFEVLCPNLSDWLFGKIPCYDTLYRTLETYCEQFEEPLNICGLSLGGILAMQYAIEHPEKMNSLVLIGTQYEMPKYLLKMQNLIFRIMPCSAFEKMGFQKTDFINLCKSMTELNFKHELLWSSIFVTLMANKIGGLQFGIYRNCQISSRVFHTAVAALPLTKANRSDFE